MYAFNSAAIFSPGHPYIESTTVLSDYGQESLPLHKVLDISLLDLPGFKIDDPVIS